MLRVVIFVLVSLSPLVAYGQGGDFSDISWGSAIVGAIGAAIAAWISGLAEEAKNLGRELMSLQIEKVRAKKRKVKGDDSGIASP